MAEILLLLLARGSLVPLQGFPRDTAFSEKKKKRKKSCLDQQMAANLHFTTVLFKYVIEGTLNCGMTMTEPGSQAGEWAKEPPVSFVEAWVSLSLKCSHCVISHWKLCPQPLCPFAALAGCILASWCLCMHLVWDSVCLLRVLCPNQELFWRLTIYPRGDHLAIFHGTWLLFAKNTTALCTLNAAGLAFAPKLCSEKNSEFSSREVCVHLEIFHSLILWPTEGLDL